MKPLVKGENFFSETYSGAKIRGVTAITKVRFLQAWKRWRAMAVLDPADTFNE